MTSSALLPDINTFGNKATQLFTSNGFDTEAKQETASTVEPEPALFYSPHRQVDTATLDEHNAAKDEDGQVGDCDQSSELCGIDLPEVTDPSALTLPENMEEIRAILEEWENDREVTLTYLESHGDDVFDIVVLSATRTGPVLKKSVLDYRYGHYALLGLTEDFVYDIVKGTVSDYFLVNVDYDLVLQHRHWTVCIDGPKLTNCALHHRSAD